LLRAYDAEAVLRILMLLLVGCNEFYGLDDTVQAPPDSDGDGYHDGIDLCPHDKRPSPTDTDGDRVGDLCDVCPLVEDDQHDEDNDNVGDACDLCPILPDFQTDIDDDKVGDACDAASIINGRPIFDAFVKLDPRWQFRGPAWQVGGDAIGPTEPLIDVFDGLVDPMVTVSARWSIELMFESIDTWKPGDRVGVHIVDGQSVLTCGAVCDASGCMVILQGATTGAMFRYSDITPRMKLRFNALNSSNQVICELDDTYMTSAFPNMPRGTPVFFATPDVRIAYVEVLD
jgi:hypothetical protein